VSRRGSRRAFGSEGFQGPPEWIRDPQPAFHVQTVLHGLWKQHSAPRLPASAEDRAGFRGRPDRRQKETPPEQAHGGAKVRECRQGWPALLM